MASVILEKIKTKCTEIKS